MNESSVHCVETQPEDPGTLRGSFNWCSYREKEDRIMRKKLKELKPVPDGVESLECRALVQGEEKAPSAYKTIENGLDWEEVEKIVFMSGTQGERKFGSNSLLLMVYRLQREIPTLMI
jgi:hypothetical protein